MLTTPAAPLSAALNSAARIVETKNMLPILAMVRLSATDGALTITTTNLDVEYRATIPCEGDLPAICVDAKRFASMVSKASGQIVMELDGHILAVKAKARWKVPTVSADDFPAMPVDALSPPMPFNPTPFVKRLLWAADSSPARAYLSGVYLNQEKGKAHAAASNGYVLPMLTLSDKWPKGAPNVILAPAFLKACPDADGTLEWDGVKARYSSGDITVTGKVIEGTFPDWRPLMAKAGGEPYAVDAEELTRAVDCVRQASDAQQRKLRLTRRAGSLHIRIEGTSGFEGEAEIDADCADGFECGVNADFLVGMLTALDTDAVSVEHPSPNEAMLLRPISGGGFQGLVWPLRI